MKNRYLILVSIWLLCLHTGWSQEIDFHLDMNNMSFFKEATLVVEGRFLKPVYAYTVKDIQGNDHYYGICPVVAYRVFKGKAKAGDTVYVTREGRCLEDINTCILDYYPFTKVYKVDPHTGDSVELDFDVQFDYPEIAFSKHIEVLSQFVNDCVFFFKESTFPKTKEKPYASMPQYQYLYPYVFYDEGTKLYVSGDKFLGLNDTLFNSRNDLYRFMLEAGRYDTTVVRVVEPKTQDKNRDYINRTLPPEVEQRWGSQKKKYVRPKITQTSISRLENLKSNIPQTQTTLV